MQEMIRGTLAMLDYLTKKYTKLDSMSRTTLTMGVRAAIQRQKYYHTRAEFFEGANRQTAMLHIYAAIRRQQYYELKVAYQMGEIVQKERDRFLVYDEQAKDYMHELSLQQAEEAEEREAMMEAEDYAISLRDAAVALQFTEQKNSVQLEVEEYYRRAAKAAKVYRAAAKAQADIDSKYAEYQEEMDEGSHKRVYMMLKEQYDEMGKTELYPFDEGRSPTDSHLTLVAPPLRPLPPDMDSVVMMKRYIHKGKAPPKRDLSEGFELNQDSTTQQDNDDDADVTTDGGSTSDNAKEGHADMSTFPKLTTILIPTLL